MSIGTANFKRMKTFDLPHLPSLAKAPAGSVHESNHSMERGIINNIRRVMRGMRRMQLSGSTKESGGL